MGANHGSRQIATTAGSRVSDLSQLPAGHRQPPHVQEHFQDQVDGRLALAALSANLKPRIDPKFLVALTDEELADLRALDLEKDTLLLDISKFLETERTRYTNMLEELDDVEDGFNLTQLLKNSQPIKQIEQLKVSCGKLKELKAKYAELHIKIEASSKADGRTNKKALKYFLGVLAGVVIACGLTLYIFAHFIPGVNIGVAAMDSALLAAGGASLAAAGLAAAAVKCLSKDEAQRGLSFLEKAELSLNDLEQPIAKLAALEDVMADDTNRKVWGALIQQILAHTDRVLALCENASSI